MLPQGNTHETILTLLSQNHIRLTPRDLVREVLEIRPGLTRRSVRQTIKALVAQGRLVYTHHFSTSHLEINYRRPAQVSERIFLSPEDCRVDHKPGNVVIRLLDGIVFGAGDHPTTRMILHGLDVVLGEDRHLLLPKKRRALDVGTGSGILALAALKLGVETAVGIDIDPLACEAARKNATLNHLSHRFEVGDQMPSRGFNQTFNLIMANLRPPTLKQLFPKLTAISSLGAIWVLSGFRVDEQEWLEKFLPHVGERHVWSTDVCDWAAWVLKFPDSPHWTKTEAC